MDFKQITLEQENAAKMKFIEHGQGINMSKYVSYEVDQDSAKWHDLIKPNLYSEQSIISRMSGLAVKINQTCDDPMLGKTDVHFSFENERDETIAFTYEESYLFLRAALRHRRSTKEYKETKAKIEELEKFVESNKTITEKRREAKAKLKELKESL